MKQIIIAALLAAGLIAVPKPAFAQGVRDDGNEWLANCNGGTHGKEMWCLGYTQSLSHGYDVLAVATKTDYYCAGSRTVTMGQLRDIMVSYLTRKPSKRSDRMMFVYIGAMQEVFPCK